MLNDSFDEQVMQASFRLEGLLSRLREHPDQPALMAEALEELSTALEELHVAGEELHAQNEELLAARQLVEEERRRYQELFDFAPDGYLVTDKLGIIREANQAAVRLLGITAEDLRGKPLLNLVTKERFSDFRNLLTDIRIGQAITRAEVDMVSYRGWEFPAALTIAVIRDSGGEVTGVRWAIRDITERQHLEVRLREANETLEQRVEERTTELREMQQRQEELLHIVSHDLRIPLTMMLGHVQLLEETLKERGLDSELRENTDTIERGVRRMNVMIQDLVDMARLESGQFLLDRTPVKLRPFIGNLLNRLEGALDVRRVSLEVPPDLPPASADEDRLERIFTNLLSNAVKYSEPGAPIRVSGCRRDGVVEVDVSDQGRGIDPDDLPRIFDRFYRARSGRTGEGLGLGLYITRMLVEAHQGRIHAESEPGKGSTFSFTLPVAHNE